MSKFFFKGRIDKREKHENHGFSTNAVVKPGSEKSPLSLVVTSQDRKAEIETILDENSLHASIVIDSEDGAEDNISELNAVLNKPKTAAIEKTPGRNEPCSCGSEKKFKKCCG